ncbi:hypothetical protein K8T06_17540 [bacterium]|nr:hypothetical protein [bacterium]
MNDQHSLFRRISSLPGTIVSAALESIQLFHFNGRIRNLALVAAEKHSWLDLFQQFDLPIFCLANHSETRVKNTSRLLLAPETLVFLKSLPQPVRILMFTPDARTSKKLAEHGIGVLGCDPGLARKLENKMIFPDIAKRAGLPVPKHIQIILNNSCDMHFTKMKAPFVCQFAKSFSGNRTFLVSTSADWKTLCKKFQGRRCRLSHYMPGKPWTANGCILAGRKICSSYPFLQETRIIQDHDGIFPDRIGSRGNSWGPLDDSTHEAIRYAMKNLGKELYDHGYTGFFGADLLKTPTVDGFKLLAIEVNPRLTASACILTSLEIESEMIPLVLLHLAESLGLDVSPSRSMPFKSHGGQQIYRPDEKYTTWMKKVCSKIYTINNGIYTNPRTGFSASELGDSEALIWKPETGSQSSELMRIIYCGNTRVRFPADQQFPSA